MDNIIIIKRWVWRILILSSIIECIIFSKPENILGCLTFIYGWGIISKFVLQRKYFESNLLPFCAIFSYGMMQFFLPLVVTLIEGKPVTFLFQVPYLTFVNQLLHVTTIVLAFRVCVSVYSPNNILSYLWAKFGYYKIPTDKQIWIMGIVGLFASVFIIRLQGTDEGSAENLGIIGQTMNQLKTFSVIPVCLLLKQLYTSYPSKVSRKVIYFYIGILVLIGIATTRRAQILLAFEVLALGYFVYILLRNKKLFSFKVNVGLILIFYLITGPLADLSTAMILNRQLVYTQRGSTTFSSVIELYNDKERLHNLYQNFLQRTDNGGRNENGWSEYYVDNIFMDRLCNLRVIDATLYYAHQLGYDNKTMHDYFENYILFQFPTPILSLLGYENFNKFEYNYTPGDLISTNGLGLREQYKGFRIAGDTGIGLYLWGYKFYIFAFLIYVCVFYFLSSLISYQKKLLPIPVIISLFSYFMYFNNGIGIFKSINLLLRAGLQGIIIYCVLFYFTRKIAK